MRAVFVGVIACVSVAVLVACGGGGTSPSGSTGRPANNQPDSPIDRLGLRPHEMIVMAQTERAILQRLNRTEHCIDELPPKTAREVRELLTIPRRLWPELSRPYKSLTWGVPPEHNLRVIQCLRNKILVQAESPDQVLLLDGWDDDGVDTGQNISFQDFEPIYVLGPQQYTSVIGAERKAMVIVSVDTDRVVQALGMKVDVAMKNAEKTHDDETDDQPKDSSAPMPADTVDQRPADVGNPAAPTADPPKTDRQPAAARKLKLARQVTDPARRRDWLNEIVKEFPETGAAREAAEDLEKLSR